MGLAYMLTFAFVHHPYLVCILFGMPSLHLFTLKGFLFSCFYTFLMLISKLMLISATARPKKSILSNVQVTITPELQTALIV